MNEMGLAASWGIFSVPPPSRNTIFISLYPPRLLPPFAHTDSPRIHLPSGSPLEALAADVRLCCGLWRSALGPPPRGFEAVERPPGFETAVPELADEVGGWQGDPSCSICHC